MKQDFRYLDDALSHWAQHSPDAPALRLMGQVTSYKALDDMANAVASALIEQGVMQGARVVLHGAKSVQLIAAAYGALRVGALYVPIDPTAPRERVMSQLSTVTPACILADERRLGDLKKAGIEAMHLDACVRLDTPIDQAALAERRAARQPQSGAYILMTSGSTGAPKGIEHTHKSGLAYASMSADLCQLTALDRVSHHTPMHFDMSIFDIFATAQVGACTVIIPEMHTKMPASLADLVQQEAITVWYSVPFAMIQLSERSALESKDLSALRVVMFAGETMPPAALKAFAKHVPDATFINAYGPTETNHCTSARFKAQDLDGVSALPIGVPEKDVQARIAQSGELLIASDQVMRGYWQDDARTHAAFATLADEDGVARRYYQTGDLVTRAADGALTLLGRADRQIKLRGYRIELDEIERALTNTPGVTEAAVVLQDAHIVAFFTGTALPEPCFVKTHIAQSLPPYALPEKLIALKQFLRTSTGKIDRNALIGQLNG